MAVWFIACSIPEQILPARIVCCLGAKESCLPRRPGYKTVGRWCGGAPCLAAHGVTPAGRAQQPSVTCQCRLTCLPVHCPALTCRRPTYTAGARVGGRTESHGHRLISAAQDERWRCGVSGPAPAAGRTGGGAAGEPAEPTGGRPPALPRPAPRPPARPAPPTAQTAKHAVQQVRPETQP